MNKIATFAVLVAVFMPSISSAAMLNAAPTEIVNAILNELILMNNQVTDKGLVAGASTMIDTGLVMKLNNKPYLQFRGITAFNVAKELCYLNASAFLGKNDNFTCEFNNTFIFESVVDAQ